MESEKLKPCPFCSSSGVAITPGESIGGNQFFALCPSCAAEGPWHKTESGATNTWNTRTPDPVKVALAEALADAVWALERGGFSESSAGATYARRGNDVLAAYREEQAS